LLPNISVDSALDILMTMRYTNLRFIIIIIITGVISTDLYIVPDAVPPIHAESSHVATDKDPSK